MNILGIGWVRWKGLLGFACVLLAAFSCGPDPDNAVEESTDLKQLALEAPECTGAKRTAILTSSDDSIDIDCSIHLQAGEVINRPLRFAGDRADNVVVDCGPLRGHIGGPEDLDKRMIEIVSEFDYEGDSEACHIDQCTIRECDSERCDGAACELTPCDLETCRDSRRCDPKACVGDQCQCWTCACSPQECSVDGCSIARNSNGLYLRERPEGITVRNCVIHGSVRVRGLGNNGEGAFVRKSSWDPTLASHTARVRDAAPTNITFDNVSIYNGSGVALYLSPGVTNFTLKNSSVRSAHVVYLDAESYGNVFENNTFDTATLTPEREVFSIDGSSGNLIMNNRFVRPYDGGIFLYRNCGEGGTIRIATPERNLIINNYFEFFSGDSNRGIYLASRNGERSYCPCDSGEDYGSSIDDRDFARYNVVLQNQMLNRDPNTVIMSADESDLELSPANGPNYVVANQRVSTRIERQAGCFLATSLGASYIIDSSTVKKMVDAPSGKACRQLRCTNGRLVDVGACSSQPPVAFGCQISGNDAGCSATANCPAGTTALGARAVCNLEGTTLTTVDLANVPIGQVGVAVPSSNWSDGLCTVGSTSVRDRADIIKSPKGAAAITGSCREHDANGGDCAIMGELYCR